MTHHATPPEVLTEVRGQMGLITLNRPKALNALSLQMVRDLMACLLAWRDDPAICAVAIRGSNKEGAFGAFCAGGDIRFLHQAALAGNPALEDFFTEEYALNHLIHVYPKPYIAFMDGVVMGGGMGISQGATLRIVTERTKMAMPETAIGLFPDVGGGYFLSRCPGRVGEYLALTGDMVSPADALAWDLADAQVPAAELPALWDGLALATFTTGAEVVEWFASKKIAKGAYPVGAEGHFDAYFSQPTALGIVQALEAAGADAWAQKTAATLRKRSPLMVAVVLEQIHRARNMTLAEDLRMERDMVRHCFNLRPGAASETVEGIRALAVDKDHNPQWNPARLEDVTADMVAPFFASPWPTHAHPLRDL